MKRSKFSLSHYRLLTGFMGRLLPLTWYEALPGDTIQHRTSLLIRTTPLMSPVMHPVRVRIHHWFVPNRLIWDNWEDFITGGPDGLDETDPPRVEFTNVSAGSLPNEMGIPAGDYTGYPNGKISVSALPFRAYNLIYNEWYRDQDLCAERDVLKTDGVDPTNFSSPARCAWEKDYFTTSRPWEQKGAEVTIPLGNSAPVVDDPDSIYDGPRFNMNGEVRAMGSSSGTTQNVWSDNVTNTTSAKWEDPGLMADLSQATGISVNDLRFSLAMQRYMENRAQWGSRYTEYLRFLGVKSSDARLQNPEFLGGGRSVIQFSEVLRHGNDADIDDNVVGQLKGHGIGATRSNRYRRFFEEHGIVLSLLSVIPKAIYTTQVERKWLRLNKEDYFQKELQYLGDQEITNHEIQMSHSQPDGVFGYQRRYDEYRSIPSGVSGLFETTLDYWHLARMFEGDVALNESFVTCQPSTRIFADRDNAPLQIMANHSIQARRMLKKNPSARTF